MYPFQTALVALATPQFNQKFKENKGTGGAMNNYLLVYLCYWEARLASNPQPNILAKLSQIYKEVGINNQKVKAAFDELQSLGWLQWRFGRYQLNQQALSNYVAKGHARPVENAALTWQIIDSMCQIFFQPVRRQKSVGLMDYIDKLLALALVATADNGAQIKEFDFDTWANWLNIDYTSLMGRLEGLRASNGLVLYYTDCLRLEEGLTHRRPLVALNPVHPWLRGTKHFYAFCQMRKAEMYRNSILPNGEYAKGVHQIEGPDFGRFETIIGDYGYYAYLKKYSDSLNDSEDAQKVTELPHWGHNAIQTRFRAQRFARTVFDTCLTISLEALQDTTLDRKTLAKPLEENALKEEALLNTGLKTKALAQRIAAEVIIKHPLFSTGEYSTIPEMTKITAENAKLLYLNMLYLGSLWITSRLLEVGYKALSSHPDGIRARLLHYATPSQEVGNNKTPDDYRLTGVAFLRVDSPTKHPRGFVQETPEDIQSQLPMTGLWYLSHDKQSIAIHRFYPLCDNNALGLIHELRHMKPTKQPPKREKSNPYKQPAIKSWLDFLKNAD